MDSTAQVQIIDDEKAWEGHHYASRTETPRNAGKFMSRVQKEWNLLRSSLPPDIYMVVYEDRCDLLQVYISFTDVALCESNMNSMLIPYFLMQIDEPRGRSLDLMRKCLF